MADTRQPSTVAILGAGFGVYGYLPAVASTGTCRVLMPERYEAALKARPALAGLAPHIQWCRSDEEALAEAEALICARRPCDHRDLVDRFQRSAKARYLIIEKPFGINATDALALHRDLARTTLCYRVGYIFRHTDWGRRFLQGFPGSPAIDISWRFHAHHYKNDIDVWKRYTSTGGGAVAFYGIHLIALLAEAGYDTVAASATTGLADEAMRWMAVFQGPNVPDCRVLVDSAATSAEFIISADDGFGEPWTLTDLTDPFATESTVSQDAVSRRNVPDPRVETLHGVWVDLLSEMPAPVWYEKALHLWRDVEVITIHEVTEK